MVISDGPQRADSTKDSSIILSSFQDFHLSWMIQYQIKVCNTISCHFISCYKVFYPCWIVHWTMSTSWSRTVPGIKCVLIINESEFPQNLCIKHFETYGFNYCNMRAKRRHHQTPMIIIMIIRFSFFTHICCIVCLLVAHQRNVDKNTKTQHFRCCCCRMNEMKR